MNNNSNDENDTGAPLPDLRASGIQLQTIAPVLGVPSRGGGVGLGSGHASPDYLDFDPKGRGVLVSMFANAGTSYLMGIGAGGMYGFRQGIQSTPSQRFRVKLNSVLNHCGRYGSRAGNTMGVFAILYSLYEGLADQLELEDRLGVSAFLPMTASVVSPAFAATAAGATYFAPSGLRVATLAGSIGFTAVACTYSAYTVLGYPYGSRGFLFF